MPNEQSRPGSLDDLATTHASTDNVRELSARAGRVYDACIHAAKALEYYPEQEDPAGDTPGRIVEAALAEVRQLRAGLPRAEAADNDWDSVRLVHQGKLLSEKKPFDQTFAEQLRFTDYQGAIDRLLMLAHWVQCNCPLILKFTMPWHEEPDWNELERQTLRLLGAAVPLLEAFRKSSRKTPPGRVVQYADEVAFRVHQLWFVFTKDPYAVDALTQCHPSGLVCCGDYQEVFASRIVLIMGIALEETLIDCRDRLLDEGPSWLSSKDRTLVKDCHMNDDHTFWRHSPKRLEEQWQTLQACAERMPSRDELVRLRTQVAWEFSQVRSLARQRERIPPARFVRVPEPGDLGFNEGPKPDAGHRLEVTETRRNKVGPNQRDADGHKGNGEDLRDTVLDKLKGQSYWLVKFLWGRQRWVAFHTVAKQVPEAWRKENVSDGAIEKALKRAKQRLEEICTESEVAVIDIEISMRRKRARMVSLFQRS